MALRAELTFSSYTVQEPLAQGIVPPTVGESSTSINAVKAPTPDHPDICTDQPDLNNLSLRLSPQAVLDCVKVVTKLTSKSTLSTLV